MALEVLRLLALALWLPVSVVGAWLLLTGRRTILGLPKGIREGWPLRAFGLAYCLAGTYLSYGAFRGSFSPYGLLFAFVSLGALILVAYDGWRKARNSGLPDH